MRFDRGYLIGPVTLFMFRASFGFEYSLIGSFQGFERARPLRSAL